MLFINGRLKIDSQGQEKELVGWYTLVEQVHAENQTLHGNVSQLEPRLEEMGTIFQKLMVLKFVEFQHSKEKSL